MTCLHFNFWLRSPKGLFSTGRHINKICAISFQLSKDQYLLEVKDSPPSMCLERSCALTKVNENFTNKRSVTTDIKAAGWLIGVLSPHPFNFLPPSDDQML